jgi:hypothetical protein
MIDQGQGAFKISVQNNVVVVVNKSTKQITTISEPDDFIDLEDAISQARRNQEQSSYKY